MLDKNLAERIAQSMFLTPYQFYILEQNGYKYDLARIRKKGNILYAPYKCKLAHNFRDAVAKMLYGARADLIGPDRILVLDRRGIKIHNDGTYTVY
jgi:hypothetical protein